MASWGLRGVRVVEGLTVGSVSGIVIATLAFFVVNRLLPLGTAFARRRIARRWRSGPSISCGSRPSRMPGCGRGARGSSNAGRSPLSLSLPSLLNWITTGDHLARSLAHRHLWADGRHGCSCWPRPLAFAAARAQRGSNPPQARPHRIDKSRNTTETPAIGLLNSISRSVAGGRPARYAPASPPESRLEGGGTSRVHGVH